ncbi:MAG: Release factor glutamine methyltransferase [Herminiimonas sp.]|nr:Release factor glutamine methyltransferase [Herminiimonas sp.]MDB5855591.1 Release factor glutamine methyltransferase [Herminiimonas sp.]
MAQCDGGGQLRNALVGTLAGLSLGSALRRAQAETGLETVDIRILFCHALGLSRVQLITGSEQKIPALQAEHLAELLCRRLTGEPIAYIVGTREFYGLALQVSPDVLIPRPETELLVELAIERLPRGGRMLDLGTGSGAIALAIAHARPDARMTALDCSAAAIEVARANALANDVKAKFLVSDWYEAVAGERFDLVVSNPPYIAANDPHLMQGDLRFEPVDALTDHGDGLGALRHIVAGAQACLEPGGWLLMEHGYDQANAVLGMLSAAGFASVRSWRDIAGIERVSGGCNAL